MGDELADAAVTDISGTGTSSCCPGLSSPRAMSGMAVDAVSSPPRDWRVEEELDEEQERGRFGGMIAGTSGSSSLRSGTVRRAENFRG